MAGYIALSSVTDHGIRNVKDSTKRADAVQNAAGRFGTRMTQIHWTLGKHDLIAIFEGPDDRSATAFSPGHWHGGQCTHPDAARIFQK